MTGQTDIEKRKRKRTMKLPLTGTTAESEKRRKQDKKRLSHVKREKERVDRTNETTNGKSM